MTAKFNGICDTCGRPLYSDGFTTGYGADDLGRRHCFICCGEHDAAYMRSKGRNTLYLVKRGDGYHVTNWPGSLDIKVPYMREGRHNMAGKRYDVWFPFEGARWHGVQYGDNTQILHARRVKA